MLGPAGAKLAEGGIDSKAGTYEAPYFPVFTCLPTAFLYTVFRGAEPLPFRTPIGRSPLNC
jgi:hypothetical protein